MQDAELVRHGVLAPRRYARDVELVSRLREPARDREAVRSGKAFHRWHASDFALQPQP